MNSLAFDTHKAVKALTQAGAAEPLAEAVVYSIVGAMGKSPVTYDTHKAVDSLKEAGASDALADAVVATIVTALFGVPMPGDEPEDEYPWKKRS
ncbi:hypothetical protein [Candidatus Spongiihabitans sp.]|uniref:hypothetical protein n=1 Tax=Candidatus Spongiihabitans sp. TaxID=3101308 RepID=UPI003C701F8E